MKTKIGWKKILACLFVTAVIYFLLSDSEESAESTQTATESQTAETVNSAENVKVEEPKTPKVEKAEDTFKPPENFILATKVRDAYQFYLDTSSVKIKTDTEKLKEWSQDGLVYTKYDNKTYNVSYNFRWEDLPDGVRRIDNIVAAKFDPILDLLFDKSWVCAFGKEYSGKMIDDFITYPYQDTLVLTWDGVDYFVKANSLDYSFGNFNVINYFSCDVAYNGEVHNFDFSSRGGVSLSIDGVGYGYGAPGLEDAKSKFVGEIYDAICYKIIRKYYTDSLSIQAITFVEEKDKQ